MESYQLFLKKNIRLLTLVLCCFVPSVFAFATGHKPEVTLTNSWVGFASIAIFVVAYILVTLEDKTHLRKSKPILIAAGIIWLLIGLHYHDIGASESIAPALNHYFLEYAQLFFFLLVAMTYINSMLERGVFDALRHWLITKGFSYKKLFWVTGCISFLMSPIADNLTTALIMCAVIMAVANGRPNFIAMCCINIVVAANAGGAFSPFGDITTLMVWQAGVVEIVDFTKLLLPSLVNFLVPASIMHFFLPDGSPRHSDYSEVKMLYGGYMIIVLFLLTIATAISMHHFLHIPPVYGMLLGLGYLKLYGFYLTTLSHSRSRGIEIPPGSTGDPYEFDVFSKIARAEWDTLFFFYGVILAVGGLSFIGYLELLSVYMYSDLGATTANILVGFLSAIIDNIPVMFAVLTMEPEMGQKQWLLVTLTAGVGGSMLSIGSAAGVALMGQARGYYTFTSHLKWAPVIALGYGLSIWVHLGLNGS